jgi:hypothetical protein
MDAFVRFRGRQPDVRPLLKQNRYRGVKRLAALLLALPSLDSRRSATAYVTDQFVLGVYSEQNQQGQRLATCTPGRASKRWRLMAITPRCAADGTTGWVKSTYLTTQVPATVRVKQLEEELDRMRATTPALAEAAAHSEVEPCSSRSSLLQCRQKWLPRAATPGRDWSATPTEHCWPWCLRWDWVFGWGMPPWRAACDISSGVSRSIDSRRFELRTRSVAKASLKA